MINKSHTIESLIEILKKKDKTESVEYIVVNTQGKLITCYITGPIAKYMAKALRGFKL